MPAIKFDLHVDMEDGESFAVTADQRDVAKFEQTSFYTTRKHTLLRFLAWSAAKRQGKTGLTWEKFSDQCVEVGDVGREDEALDPGQPEPRTESS